MKCTCVLKIRTEYMNTYLQQRMPPEYHFGIGSVVYWIQMSGQWLSETIFVLQVVLLPHLVSSYILLSVVVSTL